MSNERETCEMCGQPVEVVGGVTKHFACGCGEEGTDLQELREKVAAAVGGDAYGMWGGEAQSFMLEKTVPMLENMLQETNESVGGANWSAHGPERRIQWRAFVGVKVQGSGVIFECYGPTENIAKAIAYLAALAKLEEKKDV